jgi:hypothetical protein
MNGDTVKNVRHKNSGTLRKYLKDKSNELETNRKKKLQIFGGVYIYMNLRRTIELKYCSACRFYDVLNKEAIQQSPS